MVKVKIGLLNENMEEFETDTYQRLKGYLDAQLINNKIALVLTDNLEYQLNKETYICGCIYFFHCKKEGIKVKLPNTIHVNYDTKITLEKDTEIFTIELEQFMQNVYNEPENIEITHELIFNKEVK